MAIRNHTELIEFYKMNNLCTIFFKQETRESKVHKITDMKEVVKYYEMKFMGYKCSSQIILIFRFS